MKKEKSTEEKITLINLKNCVIHQSPSVPKHFKKCSPILVPLCIRRAACQPPVMPISAIKRIQSNLPCLFGR
jgi:hypothetical protein